MKSIKDTLKKNHSKKEHIPHVNDEKKLDPTSAKQEEKGLLKGGSFNGRRWTPEGNRGKR